jgi:hypothetical protein
MTTLKEAREKGKMDQFIKEREAEAKAEGDAEALNRGLRSMVEKSKEAPKTSSRRGRGG